MSNKFRATIQRTTPMLKKVYHEFYPIIPISGLVGSGIKDVVVLVEDEKVGYHFFQNRLL